MGIIWMGSLAARTVVGMVHILLLYKATTSSKVFSMFTDKWTYPYLIHTYISCFVYNAILSSSAG